MNLSLFTGSVPSAWKLSRVSPIFKEGDRQDINNYRPISVLPICMKIFEKLVHKQLSHYLDRNNILSENQSGFRPIHSTQTCLLNVSDYLLENMNSGYFTGAVFLDLKRHLTLFIMIVLLVNSIILEFVTLSLTGSLHT